MDKKEEQQRQILEWLEYAYAGARALDDLDTMTRIARAIKAFKLPVHRDVVISCKRIQQHFQDHKGGEKMIDRERVLIGLESLHNRLWNAAKREIIAILDASMVADVITLLKEQEPKSVEDVAPQIYCKSGLCPSCGKMLNTTCNKRYCGDCGQAVKWE